MRKRLHSCVKIDVGYQQQERIETIQITIDGPAGAGKSTIARIIADKLQILYIDTGAMYRAITYMALEKGVSCEDEQSLVRIAKETEIQFVRTPQGEQRVICQGRDVTQEIRQPQVSRKVSQVASFPGVRQVLVKKQQEMARNRDVVMDGRDAGTVILPDADCKIFLTATLEERSRRRCRELWEKGYKVKPEEVSKELQLRDKMDRERPVGPLCPAPGAVVVDSTNMTLNQVVDRILRICKTQKDGVQ